MGYTNIVGEDGRNHFGGITLTNVGVPEVTIRDAHIMLGIPVTDTQTDGIQIGLLWTTEDRGKTISNFKPPHRLKSGDRITVLYDLDELATYLAPGQRIRHECQDSFGNTYRSGWIDYYTAPNSISVYDSPGEKFREPTMG